MANRASGAGIVTCLASISVLCFALMAPACHVDKTHLEGVDISTYPPEVHADYVERMRRQPGSGIAPEESPRIQRFLHYYSLNVRARNAAPVPEVVPPPPAEDGGDAW